MTGRFLRLYPAAWIAALISFSVMSLVPWAAYKAQGINVVPQLGALARSLTLIGDYFIASSYWTLPVELAFYLVVFLSLCTGGRVTLIAVARLLVALSCPYLIFLFFHEIKLMELPWLDFGYGLKNMFLVRHGPFFAIGIYIWSYTTNRSLHNVDVLAACAAFMLAMLEITTRAMQVVGIYATAPEGAISLSFLIISSIAVFFLFLAGIHQSMLHRRTMYFSPAFKRVLRAAGLVTYPLYLLHEAVGGYVLHLTMGMAAFPVRIATALAVAILFAYVVSALGEPLLRRYLRAWIVDPLAGAPTGRDIENQKRETVPCHDTPKLI